LRCWWGNDKEIGVDKLSPYKNAQL
jgi:hypothetical protein